MANVPSMTALRAFDAVVRHGSLSGAARELCVTPAAVSHRLKDLEGISTDKLLRRDGGVFRATSHGQQVLDRLGDAFERIREAHNILTQPLGQQIEVVAAYSFAAMWLLPNLAEFQARFPDLRISIDPSHKPISHSKNSTTITIVHSDARPTGLHWQHLFDDVCAVVGAAGHPIFESDVSDRKERVGNYPLVHISHDQGTRRGEFPWSEWAQLSGYANKRFPVGLHVTAEHAAVEVIQTNQSLALVSLINADKAIQLGKIAMIEQSQQQSGRSYWYRVNAVANLDAGLLAEFANWLKFKTVATAEMYKR